MFKLFILQGPFANILGTNSQAHCQADEFLFTKRISNRENNFI